LWKRFWQLNIHLCRKDFGSEFLKITVRGTGFLKNKKIKKNSPCSCANKKIILYLK
jgi:hypothetical protein